MMMLCEKITLCMVECWAKQQRWHSVCWVQQQQQVSQVLGLCGLGPYVTYFMLVLWLDHRYRSLLRYPLQTLRARYTLGSAFELFTSAATVVLPCRYRR